MKEYYDALAPEFDEWYLGLGRFDGVERPHWDDELGELRRTLESLPAARTLDLACGTGFLTRHLRGELTGLDQSERMLEIARERMPAARFVRSDALDPPFPDGSFDRVFTAHFYGHLGEPDRERFVAATRRLASQLIVVDAARRPDRQPTEWQQRRVVSGQQFRVFKRYFSAAQLVDELGGGEVLYEGPWFLVVASS